MTSSSRDQEMLRRIEVMEAELDAGGNAGTMQECARFSLCIAKISQGLQKCLNHSEIFAILAKFSLCTFFRYDNES